MISVPSRLLLWMVLSVLIASAGCKKYSKCDELPSQVDQITGEWEWSYTIKQFFTSQGMLHNDTIWASDIEVGVDLSLNPDGCLRFTVGDEEFHTCMELYRYSENTDSVPFIVCRESVGIRFLGPDLDYEAVVSAEGSSCDETSILYGGGLPPVTESRVFISVPPPIHGFTFNSYKNVYVRK